MSTTFPGGECERPATCGVLGPEDLYDYCKALHELAEFRRLTPHFQSWIHLHKRFPWLNLFTGYPIKVSQPPFPKKDRKAAFQLIGQMVDEEVRSTFLAALLIDLMPLMRQLIRKELAGYHAAVKAEAARTLPSLAPATVKGGAA